MLQKKKVYIFTATAGAGHVKAGEAIRDAFVEILPQWEVKVIDALDYTNALFRNRYAKSYAQIVNSVPQLWGIIYDKTDNTKMFKRMAGIRNSFNLINAAKLVKLIRENPPDLAICTHFLPADILSALSKKKEIKFPWVCVVTDFEVHGFWMYENANFYAVSTELAKYQLERNNIVPEKISVLGIPISPEFMKEKDRKSIFQKLGLIADKKTVTVMSGGFGLGHVENIVKYIEEAEFDFQTIIITGKNKKLKKKLTSLKFKKLTKVLGFVDNVDEILSISDILVSKPGGLTTSESLCKGVPMVIVNAIPGQETRNGVFLMENGAAISVTNIQDIGFKIKEVLENNELIERMKENAKMLSKPRAAENLVREIIKRWF